MKRSITLWINGAKVDISDASFILYNYIRENLDNPTIVRNSFSHDVSLPGTPVNDIIFSHFYRGDFVAGSGNFDPFAKASFEVRNDRSEILEHGYCRLLSVKNDGKGWSYTVSLFGGLGEYFYNLSFYDDGSKKSLGDLQYWIPDERSQEGAFMWYNPKIEIIRTTASFVGGRWQDLRDGYYKDNDSGLINFAPVNGGIPADFDAKKAIYRSVGDDAHERLANIYESTVKDGDTYTSRGGYLLLEFENAHTEMEMQDYRAYLQRPVIRLKYIIDAMCRPENNGGYTVDLTQKANSQFKQWEDGWMMLPLVSKENRGKAITAAELLEGTDTPASYLISWCKMWGWLFVADKQRKHLTICTRDEFYNATSVVDLSRRVDLSRAISVKPFVVDARRYIWNYSEVKGAFAQAYNNTYGRDFGSMVVDTGYPFDSAEKRVFDSLAFKGAVDSQELSINHAYYLGWGADGSKVEPDEYYLKFAFTEQVKWKLYDGDGEKEKSVDCSPLVKDFLYVNYSLRYPGYGFAPGVQLYDEGGKSVDGAGVLVFFSGMASLPVLHYPPMEAYSELYLSDDQQAMLDLNGGVPCWDVTIGIGSANKRVKIDSIPVFTRNAYTNRVITDTFDFAPSRELAVPGTSYQADDMGIYKEAWRKYIGDRLSVDARVMTCFVDWHGMMVGYDLLRQFYYYDGAIWALNKISNYSLTSEALTECEFVKVNDIENYK